MRILVVEDERDLNNIIAKKLKVEGYSTDSCYNGDEALEYMELTEYDAIIMDIMMPIKNGLQVVKEMREKNNKTPVLFLTAKDSIEDRVTGLDIGADDYLVKPFAFDELMARIRVMTRKMVGSVSNVFTIGDLVVDCTGHIVTRQGNNISLSAKEFSLLEYLIRNKEIVLTREKIENHIWNYDYEGGSNMIDVYIRYLRKKIDDGYNKKLIHTIRGTGYVLREEP